MWAEQHNQPKEEVPHMNTMVAVSNKMLKEGYTESFKIDERGLYSCSTSRYYRPEQVTIVNFYRFEGQSDPGDNSILYVLETSDNLKGMLTDAYGAYADDNVDSFMKQVEDIHKKVKNHDKAES